MDMVDIPTFLSVFGQKSLYQRCCDKVYYNDAKSTYEPKI
jgi:hypothetical protein